MMIRRFDFFVELRNRRYFQYLNVLWLMGLIKLELLWQGCEIVQNHEGILYFKYDDVVIEDMSWSYIDTKAYCCYDFSDVIYSIHIKLWSKCIAIWKPILFTMRFCMKHLRQQSIFSYWVQLIFPIYVLKSLRNCIDVLFYVKLN